jgi:hypothetical protein
MGVHKDALVSSKMKKKEEKYTNITFRSNHFNNGKYNGQK